MKTHYHYSPDELSPHPLQSKALPMSETDYAALLSSVAEDGIRVPLLINSKRQILDGVHRWKCAKERRIKQIPCLIDDEADPAKTVLVTSLSRRQLDQGQKALLVCELHEDIVAESKARQLKNLKKGQQIPVVDKSTTGNIGVFDDFTAEKLAARYGVSEAYIKFARTVHTLPEERKRAVIDDIINQRKSLSAVYRGIGGMKATKGKPKGGGEGNGKPFDLMEEAIRTLAIRLGRDYPKLSDEDQLQLLDLFEQIVLPVLHIDFIARIKGGRQ